MISLLTDFDIAKPRAFLRVYFYSILPNFELEGKNSAVKPVIDEPTKPHMYGFNPNDDGHVNGFHGNSRPTIAEKR